MTVTIMIDCPICAGSGVEKFYPVSGAEPFNDWCTVCKGRGNVAATLQPCGCTYYADDDGNPILLCHEHALISDAARAVELYGDDELERYASRF